LTSSSESKNIHAFDFLVGQQKQKAGIEAQPEDHFS